MDDDARRAALADLHALPGHLLWRSAARVSAAVATILPGGTDIHGYAVLVALSEEEPQSQSSLARTTGVSGTTMTSVAETLLRDELVERVRNPEDRRSYSLTRTAGGRDLRHWAPQVRQLEARLTADLGEDDAARLRSVLRRLVGDQLDARTPQPLLESTGFLLTRAHQRVRREFVTALAPLGIDPRHFGTLRCLRAAGPATQGQVAALLDVSPATVVQMVDQLEDAGLVRRERDPADRRAYRLHLEPAAEDVLEQAMAISAAVLAERVGSPRGRDHRDLVRLLGALLAAAPATDFARSGAAR